MRDSDNQGPAAGSKRSNSPGKRSWLRGFFAARLDPKTYLGLHLSVGLLVAAGAIWLFGALLEAVLDNALLVRWDVATDAWIHAHATPLGQRNFDVITQLGSPVAMTLLALAGAVLLWTHNRRTVLIGWLAAFVGGTLIDQALKLAVHRSRPIYGAAYLHGHSYSFPSGHAMGSIIGYGMLVYVARLYWHPQSTWRALMWIGAGAMVLIIGVSRVYLGVHYPSDVLGGYAAGSAWMAVSITGIGVALQRHMDRAHPEAASLVSQEKGDADSSHHDLPRTSA